MSAHLTIQPDTEKFRKRQFENSSFTQIKFPKKAKFNKIPSSFAENNRNLLSIDIPKNVKKNKRSGFQRLRFIGVSQNPRKSQKAGQIHF